MRPRVAQEEKWQYKVLAMHGFQALISHALPRVLAAGALLMMAPACDGGSDDGETGEHGDHTGSGEGSESDPDTSVEFTEDTPTAVTVGTEFAAGVEVITTGALHVAEIRVCNGADVADCGQGDMDSFDMSFTAEAHHTGHYEAMVTLDAAGDYTFVGFVHVGENPHYSEPMNVTASE